MKFIYLPLGILIFSAIFFQLYSTASYDLDDNATLSTDTFNISQSMNGTETFIEYDLAGIPLAIDIQTGALAIILAFVSIAFIVSINVVGSGMNTFGSEALYKSFLYFIIWSIFSALGIQVFTIIPLFGWLLYLVMTIFYGLGIVQEIG